MTKNEEILDKKRKAVDIAREEWETATAERNDANDRKDEAAEEEAAAAAELKEKKAEYDRVAAKLKKRQAAADEKTHEYNKKNAVLKSSYIAAFNQSMAVISELHNNIVFAEMIKDLSIEMWINTSNNECKKDSNRLTLQILQNPHGLLAHKQTDVDPFPEPDNTEAFTEAANQLAIDGNTSEFAKSAEQFEATVDDATANNAKGHWNFPPDQPRAFIGSSDKLHNFGFFVPQSDDKKKIWVSKAQAAIYRDENGAHWWLDLDSSKEVLLILPHSKQGVKVGPTGEQRCPLEDGTIVLMGDTVLLIRLPTLEQPDYTVEPTKFLQE